jgi:hypothetical protein
VKKPRAPALGFFKEKAFLAVHPRSSERGILAFSRKGKSSLFSMVSEVEKPGKG